MFYCSHTCKMLSRGGTVAIDRLSFPLMIAYKLGARCCIQQPMPIDSKFIYIQFLVKGKIQEGLG
jgi:hypothetical protein